jgi:hypothetical protein
MATLAETIPTEIIWQERAALDWVTTASFGTRANDCDVSFDVECRSAGIGIKPYRDTGNTLVRKDLVVSRIISTGCVRSMRVSTKGTGTLTPGARKYK